MAIHDGRVISNFIMQALNNKDITIYGDGEQTRSFCYVDDLIRGMIKVMHTPEQITGPINLGNPIEISVLNVAQKIIKLTRSKSKIVHKNSVEDDPRYRQPDITLAKRLIDWNPSIDFDKGLKYTVNYFKAL
jgi:UDP-glucuronate decarboxylase